MKLNLFRFVFVIAVGMVVAPLAAPQGAGAGLIEGIVVDLNTKEPIAGAEVELTRIEEGVAGLPAASQPARGRGNPVQQGPRGARGQAPLTPSDPLQHLAPVAEPDNFARLAFPRAKTEADGKFRFRDVAPGKYALVVTRAGGAYNPAEYGQRDPRGRGLTFPMANGQEMKNLTLEMAPTGAIAGRVIDENGEGIGRAVVVAFERVYRDGLHILNIVQIVHTSTRGEYRLRSLPPGEYYVSARLESPDRPEGDYVPVPGAAGLYQRGTDPVITRRILPTGEVVEETYGSVFFGNVNDPDKAQRIELAAGETRSAADIFMKPMPARHVRGTTPQAPPPDPPPMRTDVEIRATRLQSSSDFIILRGRSDATGAFDVPGATSGSYVFAFGAMSTPVHVDVGNSDLPDVKLILAPANTGMRFSGRLTIDGRPPDADDPVRAGTRLRLIPDHAALLSGISPPNRPFNASVDIVAPVSGRGAFSVQFGLRRGNFRVEALGIPPGMYVRSIRLGAADVLNQGLPISGPIDGVMEVEIGTDAGSISGSVVDIKDSPLANTVVALVPAPALRKRLDLFRSATTDAAGQFNLKSIPPGDYKLFSWSYAKPGSWEDPEFLRAYEADGVPVHVDSNSARTERLHVIPTWR